MNKKIFNLLFTLTWSAILAIATTHCFVSTDQLNLIYYIIINYEFSYYYCGLIYLSFLCLLYIFRKQLDFDNHDNLLNPTNNACLPLFLLIPLFFFEIDFLTLLIYVGIVSLTFSRLIATACPPAKNIFNLKISYRTSILLILLIFSVLVCYGWYIQCRAVKVMYLPWTDWGYLWNAMHNTLHGKFFYCNKLNLNHLGIHFSPYLLFLAPIVWIFQNYESFFLMNSLIIFSGGLCIYYFCRSLKLSYLECFLISMLYFFNPGIFNLNLTNLYSFHEINIIFSIMFLVLAFYERGKYLPMIALIILSLLVKETVSIMWFGFGVMLLFKRKYKISILTMLVSMCYFIIVMKLIMPAINGEAVYSQAHRFAHLGANYSEILLSPFTKPEVWWQYITRYNIIIFIIMLILPFIFIVLNDVTYLIPILPLLTFICLQSSNQLQNIMMQYQSMPLTILFIAFCYNYKNLKKKTNSRLQKLFFVGCKSKIQSKQFAFSLMLGCIFASILFWFLFAQTHFSKNSVTFILKQKDCTPYIDEIKKYIPKSEAIVVSDRLAPHFCGRNELYFDIADTEKCDYVLLDVQDSMFGADSRKIRKKLLQSSKFRPVKTLSFNNHCVVLFKKNTSNKLTIQPHIDFPSYYRKIQIPLDNQDFSATAIFNPKNSKELFFLFECVKKVEYDVKIKVIVASKNDRIYKSFMYGYGFQPAYLAEPGQEFCIKIEIPNDFGAKRKFELELEKL